MLFEKKKFVLVVGDDGAILSLFNGKKVEKRLFSISASVGDRREMHSLFTKYPDVSIYMMLDTMEQSYTKQTLPAVSPLAIGKLVNKRLERDFAESDIKGAVPFGRDEEGRHDWIYMFAAAPVTPDIMGWIEYISLLENKFVGIYMLPVEMGNFVKSLYKGNKGDAAWKFIVTHNKTGGFRQVVMQNDKVVFTRLIRQGEGNVPEIIAGNIEQEILNTLDYLRRLSLSDEDAIDVIAVVSKEIKQGLEGTKFRGHEIHLYTPYEASRTMKLAGVAGDDDKFCDILIAANFIHSKPTLRLENPKMKEMNTLLAVYNFANYSMLAIMPILGIYAAFLGYSIFSTNSDVNDVETRKAGIEKKWRDARKSDQYDIDDANKIMDFVTLHKELSQSMSPLDIISSLREAQKEQATTRSLSWKYITQKVDNKKGTVDAIFNMEFYNSGDGLEELFENFDTFTGGIRESLGGYRLDISDLPKKVNFDDKSDIVAVKVKANLLVGEGNNADSNINMMY